MRNRSPTWPRRIRARLWRSCSHQQSVRFFIQQSGPHSARHTDTPRGVTEKPCIHPQSRSRAGARNLARRLSGMATRTSAPAHSAISHAHREGVSAPLDAPARTTQRHQRATHAPTARDPSDHAPAHSCGHTVTRTKWRIGARPTTRDSHPHQRECGSTHNRNRLNGESAHHEHPCQDGQTAGAYRHAGPTMQDQVFTS